MTRPGGLLAVSIGNSHTTLGLVEDGQVVADWRVSTDETRTADEWAALLTTLPGTPAPGTLIGLAGVVVCSTVPSVLLEWRIMLARHVAQARHVVVEPGVRTGIGVRTDNPREVGADRVVNALAALTHYGSPAIVVDFGGTATTFDVVDAEGQYVGGAIAPGIALSLQALGRRGAQLRAVELARPRSAIARNTVEALQSGVVFGVASQVEGLVARMIAELGELDREMGAALDIAVVSTGAFADVVTGECTCFTAHDSRLTLRGLVEVFERNV